MFEQVQAAPPDPILGLTEAWKSDPNPQKINLGVGVYKDDQGTTPILPSVKQAEANILANGTSKSYMPIGGSPAYRDVVQSMLLGEGHPLIAEKRIATAHTPGGTGGLRVGADLLKTLLPEATVWMSSPTWANHKGIFKAAGFAQADYPYYDPASKSLDFDAMIAALDQVPAGDIVLLHVCCHNPTGVDPTPGQWEQIAATAAARGWLPFLDFAYQGFGVGIEEDRAGLLAIAEACPEFVVASSFSKNFGLYQDRTGALSIVSGSAGTVAAVYSNLLVTIRVNYSNPPAHGGLIVEEILGDKALTNQWLAELAGMRERIAGVRKDLVKALDDRSVPGDRAFLIQQKGMFSFSGLTDDQVRRLREEKSIYIVKGGRINVAGITAANLDYLADAIAGVM